MDAQTTIDESSRPLKRRRFYRKHPDSLQDDQATLAETPASSNSTPNPPSIDHTPAEPSIHPLETVDDDDHPSLSVADLLRRRRTTQRKRAGIEFTNTPAVQESGAVESVAGDGPLDKEASLDKILTVVDRFAPQTGQVADVDKHMMAYIDSELAKRRQSLGDPVTTFHGTQSHNNLVDGLPADLAKHRQPAALGKLHEIDLGADATLKNIARTEAAKRRLEGGEPEVEETTGKVRLRKDGKPWRGRRRRNSDDVKRDRLVEEVMRESRLEIYDEPEEELPHDDQAADDRIAEQFRREFMDAISSRRQKASQTAKKGSGAKVDDKPRGPKLGGSRSARAAMREQQEKATKK
ncbi:MAG: hypothetical protein LQ349_001330 [Xanthoria aureola]|nr:MAG: hypothetical protein LQ349_001330 [Xanthoria aureola]